LLKIGSKTVNFEGSLWVIALSYLTTPALLAGFAAYALGAFLWIFCLAKFDLSYVTFVTSFQYILLLLVSITVFHEQLSMMRWAACAVIMVGVVMYMKG
jgi:drug/metabolite transporter (DMT)-like permease